MTQPEIRDEQLRTLQTIVGSLVLGVGLFAGVAVYLIRSGTFGETGALIALEAVGVVVVVLLLTAPLVASRLKDAPAGADRDTVYQRFQTGTIVGMALREGAGLMGGILAMLSGSLPWLLGLTGVSMLAMILAWPRRDDLEERLRQVGS